MCQIVDSRYLQYIRVSRVRLLIEETTLTCRDDAATYDYGLGMMA